MQPRITLERFDPERPAGDGPDPDGTLPAVPAPAAPPTSELEPEPETPDPGPALERIASLLEACLANAVELRRGAERAAAAAFGRAAEAVIPVLAGRGFAEEIAAAARALSTSTAPQSIVLTVAAEELEAVAAALQNRTGGDGIILRTAPALNPGQAEVSWADGGAEIDIERLTAEALRILEQHLPT